MKWNRAELKTMNLLTDGTSRAAVSGSSRSLTGTWQGREEVEDEWMGWSCLHATCACTDLESAVLQLVAAQRQVEGGVQRRAARHRQDALTWDQQRGEWDHRPAEHTAHQWHFEHWCLYSTDHLSVLQAKRWHLDWGVTVEEDTGSQTHCYAYALYKMLNLNLSHPSCQFAISSFPSC